MQAAGFAGHRHGIRAALGRDMSPSFRHPPRRPIVPLLVIAALGLAAAPSEAGSPAKKGRVKKVRRVGTGGAVYEKDSRGDAIDGSWGKPLREQVNLLARAA